MGATPVNQLEDSPQSDVADEFGATPAESEPLGASQLDESRRSSGISGQSVLDYYSFLDGGESTFAPAGESDALDHESYELGETDVLEECEMEPELPRPQDVEGFKAALRAEAHRRLDCTVSEILVTLDTYADADGAEPESQRSSHWENLQRVMAYDRELAVKYGDYSEEAAGWQQVLTGDQGDCDACHYGDPAQLSQDSKTQAREMAQLYSQKAQFVETLRSDIRSDHPEFALLGDTANTKGAHRGTDAEVYNEMETRGQAMLISIADIRTRIDSGDMPLSKLDPVLEAVKLQFDISRANADQGDPLSEVAIGWIDRQRNWEFVIEVGGAVLGGALGLVALGCLFVPGGWAATAAIVGYAAGAVGAGVGLAQGLYSLERADDLSLAAEAGDSLIADPEAAKWNYTMAKLGMALALLDTVLTVADLIKLARIPMAAGAMPTPPPGSVDFARLTPEQKLAVGHSIGYGDRGLMQIGRANTYASALEDPTSSLHWLNQLPEADQLRLVSQAREAGSMRGVVDLPEGGMARQGDFGIIGRDREAAYHDILGGMKDAGNTPTNIGDIIGSQTLSQYPDDWPVAPQLYQGLMRDGLWNPTANFAWLEGVVTANKPVVITEAYQGVLKVDISTGGKSFTAREVEFLMNRGYRWDPGYTGPGGGRLIPPDLPSLDSLPRLP